MMSNFYLSHPNAIVGCCNEEKPYFPIDDDVGMQLTKATTSLQNARMSVCAVCQYKVDNVCGKCHCAVAVRASFVELDCPDGRWLVDLQVQKVMNDEQI